MFKRRMFVLFLAVILLAGCGLCTVTGFEQRDDPGEGSHATITAFSSAQALVVDLSGGSYLQGDIEAGNVTFDLAGSSEVDLADFW